MLIHTGITIGNKGLIIRIDFALGTFFRFTMMGLKIGMCTRKIHKGESGWPHLIKYFLLAD